MDRRHFIQAVSLLPLVTGCALPATFDRAKYGQVRRVGVVVHSHRFVVQISRDSNMYAQMGSNDAMAGKIKAALGARCDGFGNSMRTAIIGSLNNKGIEAKELAFRDEVQSSSSVYRTPNYKNVGEPYILDCQTMLSLARTQDAVIPGVGAFVRLVNPDGDTMWGSEFSIGPAYWPNNKIIAMPTTRFVDLDDIIASPDRVADSFMSLAGPLGNATAGALLQGVGVRNG